MATINERANELLRKSGISLDQGSSASDIISQLSSKVSSLRGGISAAKTQKTTSQTTPAQAAILSATPIQSDFTQPIKDMYDAQIAAEKARLQESGDQALSDAQANRDKIADTYYQQKNAAAVDWERQRRNFLEGAMSSGLNTGAGSQAELSMMGMYQRSQNNLQGQQAQAEANADRNIADIRRNTQAAINEAISKNDYQKAAALLDEYNQQYNRALAKAETLASFGDFSGYSSIYGSDVAMQMFNSWAAKDPDTAYKMGAITEQQYRNLRLGKPINATSGLLGSYSGSALSQLTGGDPWDYGGSGWNSGGSGGGSGTSSGYKLGELLSSASKGYNAEQMLDGLVSSGVPISDAVIQDVLWARGK